MNDIFTNEKMLCANRIKLGLKLRNLKQSELCEMTGIPKSAMSQYISGAFKPKQDRVYLIAKALNTSEAWIMGYDVPLERNYNETDTFDEKPSKKEKPPTEDEELNRFLKLTERLSDENYQKLLDYMELLLNSQK